METLNEFFRVLPSVHDVADFPFIETINIYGDYDSTQSCILEIQEWLMENISNLRLWRFGSTYLRTTHCSFRIFFKHPEDVMAFKLRWL